VTNIQRLNVSVDVKQLHLDNLRFSDWQEDLTSFADLLDYDIGLD